MKIVLLTQWRDGEIVCTCPIEYKCRKEHYCEELTFTLEPTYKGIKECFKNSEKRK